MTRDSTNSAERRPPSSREASAPVAAQEAQEAPDRPVPRNPERLRIGFWMGVALFTLFAIFGLGGAWAMFTNISGAVIAQGFISPESGIQPVQHPDGGVVQEIHVREGDRVNKGDVLLVLDDAELRTMLAMVEGEIDAAQAEIARLEAERDRAETIRFPPELIERAAGNEAVQRMLESQRRLFEQRRDLLESQRRILQQQMEALKRQQGGISAQLKALEVRRRLIQDEVETVTKLVNAGQARRPRLLALLRQQAALEGEIGRLNGEQARIRELMAQIGLQMATLERDFHAKALERLVTLRRELNVNLQKRLELKRKLAKTVIRAPVSGRILNMRIRTVGGVIAPREPILQIVPVDDPLVLIARVRPVDIDEVHPGQRARVMFTAFSARTTPELYGKVRDISPAPLIDEATRQPYYRVEVVVPTAELQRLPSDTELVPGMPSEIFLTTRDRTPMDIILDPLTTSIRRAFRAG